MDKTAPAVSVIMNCLNAESYLREAIESVYSQTVDDWEIVFWDNHSTDRSLEIARSFDNRVKIFESKKTIPLGQARNKALKEASGEYICFLDCDDAWDPNKLELQLQATKENPEVGLVYTNYRRLDDVTGNTSPVFTKRQPSGDIFGYCVKTYQIGMLTVMLSRKSLDKVEPWFDKQYQLIPDFDLFMRVLLLEKAAYVDQVLATYRVHSTSLSQKHADRFPDEALSVLARLMSLDTSKQYVKLLKRAINEQKHYKLINRYLRKGRIFEYISALWNESVNPFRHVVVFISFRVRRVVNSISGRS